MRTTINLPDALGESVKRRAHEQGRTFTSFVEEALRLLLDGGCEPSLPIDPLPSHGDPDARSRIDLADRDAVWDVLDGR